MVGKKIEKDIAKEILLKTCAAKQPDLWSGLKYLIKTDVIGFESRTILWAKKA